MKSIRAERLKIDVVGGMVALGLCAAGYFFGLHPVLAAHAATGELNTELLTLSEQVEAQRIATQGYEAALSIIEERLSEGAVTLGSREGVSDILAMVGQAAEARGLVIDALTPRPVEKGKGFDRIPMEVRGRGRYPDVAAFLHDLRVRDITIAVRVLDIRSDPARQGSSFDLELVWFVRSVPSGG
ncbi:MAG: type 4a pilus biogenesis protein PilO [Phycisphaerales bacterium]|nr:type 4a pilus biogenesis protein PilO [Phycisphaerales bacterium]